VLDNRSRHEISALRVVVVAHDDADQLVSFTTGSVKLASRNWSEAVAR
jgi:predicted RNA-binding protein with PIN domain